MDSIIKAIIRMRIMIPLLDSSRAVPQLPFE
jgi:hypothetical protein